MTKGHIANTISMDSIGLSGLSLISGGKEPTSVTSFYVRGTSSDSEENAVTIGTFKYACIFVTMMYSGNCETPVSPYMIIGANNSAYFEIEATGISNGTSTRAMCGTITSTNTSIIFLMYSGCRLSGSIVAFL